MSELVQLILDAKTTNVDEFAKKTLEIKDRLDGVSDSAVNLAGKWGRLFMVANLIPGVGGLISTAFKAVAIASTVATAGIGAMTVMVIRSAQRMTTLSDRTNALRGDLQALRFAAEATSTPLESIHDVFLALTQVQGEMQAGIGKSTERLKALEALGITLDDIKKKDAKKIFTELVERLGAGAIATDRMASGVKLFGESFRDVVSASKQDMSGLLKEWAKMEGSFMNNLTVSETATDTLDQIGNAWDKMWAKVGASAKHASSELVAAVANAGKLALWNNPGGIIMSLFPGAKEKSQQHLTEAYEYFALHNTGKRDAEASDRRTQDARNARAKEDEIGGLKSNIRTLVGDEFDIDFEEMDERGARAEEYSRMLRRVQKRKAPKAEKEHSASGSMMTGDILSRQGLFRGGSGGVLTIMQKQEKKLNDIHRELRTQTALTTKEE